MAISIYGLCDPRDGVIRYVGKARNPKRRLAQHLNDALSRRHDWPVQRWIRKLADDGVQPVMVLLEETTEAEWKAVECRWITHYHVANGRMLNVAPGGEGVSEADFERGEQRYNHKLTDGLVRQMREERAAGAKYVDLSRCYGVNIATVHNICTGVYWQHAGGPLTKGKRIPPHMAGSRHPGAKLTEADVAQIRALYAIGEHTQTALARQFGVTQAMIWVIVNGRNWTQQ